MNDDLYFIPIIARAMEASNSREAFGRAFEEILLLGHEPRYQRGLRQFAAFLAVGARHTEAQPWDSLDIGIVRAVLAELAHDPSALSDETRLALVAQLQSCPEWQREYSRFLAESGDDSRPVYPDLLIKLQDGQVETVHLDAVRGTASIGGILPGEYEISFDTGRMIWAGTLTRADLIWSAAYSGAPAGTRRRHRRPPPPNEPRVTPVGRRDCPAGVSGA